MRYYLLLAAVLLAGCQSKNVTEETADSPANAEDASADAATETETVETQPVAFNTAGDPTVTFSVPDMHCEFSCTPAVRAKLADQPGVKDVKVDLETKTAVVAVQPDKFDAEAAVAALVDIQFTDTKILEDSTAKTQAATTDAKKS